MLKKMRVYSRVSSGIHDFAKNSPKAFNLASLQKRCVYGCESSGIRDFAKTLPPEGA